MVGDRRDFTGIEDGGTLIPAQGCGYPNALSRAACDGHPSKSDAIMLSEFVDLNSSVAVDQLRENMRLMLDEFEPTEFESLLCELRTRPETARLQPNEFIERYWARKYSGELRQAVDIANAIIDSDLPNHST